MDCSSVLRLSGRCVRASSACSKYATASELAGALCRLDTGLTQVTQGLVPHLATHGVVGESVDLLSQPVGIEGLERLNNARMQHAPPLYGRLP